MFYKGIVGPSLSRYLSISKGLRSTLYSRLYTISLLHALVCEVILIGTPGIKNGLFSFFLSLLINSFYYYFCRHERSGNSGPAATLDWVTTHDVVSPLLFFISRLTKDLQCVFVEAAREWGRELAYYWLASRNRNGGEHESR